MKHSHQRSCVGRTARAGVFLCVCMASLPGCASLTSIIEARSIPVAGPANPVVDFACIWQQGEGRTPNGMPCRGFCGQLLFTTAAGKKPGTVNGAVTVYVFDNVGTVEEQARPFEVFNFTPEEWQTFGHRTNLGMTYQLFIPYTRPGGHEAECQIHVKYTPADSGMPIMSHPETVSLRGTLSAGAAADALDRKLMNSSPLFAQSPLMKPALSDAAYKDLLRKYQSDSAVAAGHEAGARAVSSAAEKRPADKSAEIQRLQAILDESSSRQVSHANYSEVTSAKDQVQSADYETDDETEADGRSRR